MRDRRVRLKRRLDDHAIEGLERDSLPVQVGGGPPGHAVEVGGELSAGKRRELGQWHGEGFGHRAADLDHRIGGDSGRRSVEVRTEAREPIDRALAGGKRHVSPGPSRPSAGRSSWDQPTSVDDHADGVRRDEQQRTGCLMASINRSWPACGRGAEPGTATPAERSASPDAARIAAATTSNDAALIEYGPVWRAG